MKDKNKMKWEIDQLGGMNKAYDWFETEKDGLKNLQMPTPSSFGSWVEDKISDIFGKIPKR